MKKNILFLDIETGYSKGSLVKLTFSEEVLAIGVFDYNRSKYSVFQTKDEFYTYLNSYPKNEKVTIYAHNGGKFDYLYFIKDLPNVKLWLNDSQFIAAFYKNFTFFDSLNILRSSLDNLGKLFGKTQKSSISYNTWVSRESMETYLMLDCLTLRDILTTFAESLSLTIFDLGCTLPSISYKKYQSYIGKSFSTLFPPLFTESFSFLSTAYFGGRVEVFQHHLSEGICLDINSLYPYVMQKYAYPIGLPTKSIRPQSKLWISNITITDYQESSGIPVLALKTDKLIFPVGTFTTWITNEEFAYLQLRKKQGKCSYTIQFNETYNFRYKKVFSDYILELYKTKQFAKSEIEKQTAKLLMNSLYGKFGQKPERTESIIVHNSADLHNYLSQGYDITYESDTYFIIQKSDTTTKRSYFPLAIFVTAYARLELCRALHKLSDLSIPCVYCDTDSIFTTSQALAILPISPAELGCWKLEYSFVEGYFEAPKMYAVTIDGTTKLKAKGFPAKALTGASSPIDLRKGKAWQAIAGMKEYLKGKPLQIQRVRTTKKGDTKRQWKGNKSMPWKID